MRAPVQVRALAALVLATALVGAPPSARAAGGRDASCAALDGTFVQLTSAAAARPRAEWERLFADMAALGIEQVFLQWTAADGVAFHPAGGEEPRDAAEGMVDLVLELAARHGQRVWLGLAHDAGWWAGIDRARPASEVEVFLARRRLANLAVARALAPLASRPSFAGWYVPDEVDDVNWLGDERRALLAEHLARLAGGLRALAPGAPVAVSGFAAGRATPEQLAGLWSAVVTRAELALVLLQDGVGAAKLELDELAAYLPPLRAALEPTSARLGVVIELFTARPEPAGEGGGFAATPAPLARVERQIALARRYASGPLVVFSVPDYMSPFAGPDAERLYASYRARLEGCRAVRRSSSAAR